jgi:hypothetical protein
MLLGVLFIGCGHSSDGSGTGAKECAQGFYEAIVRQDWANAYATLDPETKKRWKSEQFTQLAKNYRSSLGFEPEAVHIRACDEQNADATAHIVLTGRTTTQDRRHNDAVALRRTEDGWRIVLPESFGRSKKR